MKHCPRLRTPVECLLFALQSRPPPQSSSLLRRDGGRRTLKFDRVYRSTPKVAINDILAAERAQQRQERLDAQSPFGNVRELQPRSPLQDKRLTGYIYDEAVQRRWAQLKDEKANTLAPPQLVTALLEKIDRSKEVLVQLGFISDDTAVVTISNREALAGKAQERATAMKENQKLQRATKTKQIELNWAISENDLKLKLKQMKDFLEKGRRVEILMANKKRQRKATEEESQAMLDQVREALGEVGAREIGKMDGQVGKQAVLIAQKGKTQGHEVDIPTQSNGP